MVKVQLLTFLGHPVDCVKTCLFQACDWRCVLHQTPCDKQVRNALQTSRLTGVKLYSSYSTADSEVKKR